VNALCNPISVPLPGSLGTPLKLIAIILVAATINIMHMRLRGDPSNSSSYRLRRSGRSVVQR
jgi:hypothetical protein